MDKQSDRFLTETEVLIATGLSRVTRWRMERDGQFPKRRKISPQRVGWLESEINDWMTTRPVSIPDYQEAI